MDKSNYSGDDFINGSELVAHCGGIKLLERLAGTISVNQIQKSSK